MKKRVKIENIRYGWLDFTIYDGNKEKTSRISYLENFIGVMRDLLNVQNHGHQSNNIKRVHFDCEGQDLYLTAIRENYGDNLYIVWEQYIDKPIIEIFQFNYEEFNEAFEKEFGRVQKRYYKHFDWDTMCALDEEFYEEEHNNGNN